MFTNIIGKTNFKWSRRCSRIRLNGCRHAVIWRFNNAFYVIILWLNILFIYSIEFEINNSVIIKRSCIFFFSGEKPSFSSHRRRGLSTLPEECPLRSVPNVSTFHPLLASLRRRCLERSPANINILSSVVDKKMRLVSSFILRQYRRHCGSAFVMFFTQDRK